MIKTSWGTKRTCPCGNGVRFYDLNKKEIECPSCGESINVEQLSISNIENNLRKKPQTRVVKEIKEPKESEKKSKTPDLEVQDAELNEKTEVEDIITDKTKKKLDKLDDEDQ